MQKALRLPWSGDTETNQMLVMVGWIGVIHFFVEALIMGMLSGWQLSRTVIMEGLLDCTLLTIFSSPLIYLLVAKPFIVSTNTAETALSQELQIRAQQTTKLETALATLSQTLEQNDELRNRLQKSNEKVADVNERTLQRIGADLHDGPAQLLTYSLMRLGKFSPVIESAGGEKGMDELRQMRAALADTLTEIRNISQGLSLPQLGAETLEGTIALAVTLHQERTGTKVEVATKKLPSDASQAQKVCVYRVVQESLANAYKHGKGTDQRVAAYMDKQLVVEISDTGPGFDPLTFNRDGLGLTGMRARVESLGGTLAIDSAPGRGTCVTVKIDSENSRGRGAADDQEV